MQEFQGAISTPKDKQSLRDIQEEEQARQQEADFLKWWAAEEERVRLEMLEQGRERERVADPRAGASLQNKNKGGKARPRKAKAETQFETNPSNVVTQRESRGHRKPRQREDTDCQVHKS